MRYVLIALLLLPVLAAAGVWRIEIVDPDNAGGYPSLVLDSSGYPHIAYTGYSSDIMYANWDGAAWQIETIDENLAHYYVSLALDDNDRPHISYISVFYDYDDDYYYVDLKYAHWNGSEWIIETVDFDLGWREGTSLALDSSGYPHISYTDCNLDALKYAYWDGNAWQIEVVDTTNNPPWSSSLELDSYDYPHISYWGGSLWYARWDGESWQIETVDPGTWVGGYTSLALNSSSNPCIAYYYASGWNLRYAYWNGVEWQIETVDSENQTGQFPSLALDSNDYPHISYLNYTFRDLRYARWDGYEWLISELDFAEDYEGEHSSLVVDSSDNPHISFGDWLNADLGYAWYDPNGFHLLDPENGEVVETTTPLLDWEDSPVPDHESYTLWWGEDPYFETYNEVTDIADSEYQIKDGIEDGDRIWWRVKSIDEGGGEYWAEEMDWRFTVDLVFHLLSPERGEVVDTTTPVLDWEDSPVPDHESYTLWWGTDPDFYDYNEVADIGESEYTITEGIQDGDRIYWRVKSIDDQSEEYWAVEMDWRFTVDTGGGVDIVDFAANAEDEGILVNWRIEGDSPSGLRVLRTIGDEEPIFLHTEPLNGDATKYLDRGVSSGVEYCYWLEVTEADGSVKRFGPTESVTVPEYIPELILYAAYPNPSRETINFVFSLPEDGRVELSVYDLSGRRVASLINSDLTAGRHEVSWSCADVESGVYLYRLETEAGSITQRLVVSR